MHSNQNQHEHPSTYFVPDRSSKEDLARLLILDRMMTHAMGGVLPEQADPSRLRRVLDIGCGTGGWLIEMAQTYPAIEQLIGIDVSRQMVTYARTQAAIAGVSDRVSFEVMDALRMLEFPTGTFDLVNQRSGASYLRTWEWSKLLQEGRRVVRVGGVLRLTEGEWQAESTSPALTHLFALLLRAFSQAGHSFTEERDGVTSQLERLLRQHGCDPVHRRLIRTNYRAGAPEGQWLADDLRLTFKLLIPFLHKWAQLPDDYEQCMQQAWDEMHQPTFVASGHILTAWGITTAPVR
jgi:ubiquinone/menaquinone biosynthesis C-methylase UbiE